MLSAQSSFTKIIFKGHLWTIYIITIDDHIAHLSFTPERHIAAINRIQSINHNCIIKKESFTDTPIHKELEEYFAGQRRYFSQTTSPFFLVGATPLRQRIWQRIAAIPYGKTATYGEIGRDLGNHALARAIGQAANANPLPLIIPCHRIVGRHDLGGYAGGTTIKKYLLQLESENLQKQ